MEDETILDYYMTPKRTPDTGNPNKITFEIDLKAIETAKKARKYKKIRLNPVLPYVIQGLVVVDYNGNSKENECLIVGNGFDCDGCGQCCEI